MFTKYAVISLLRLRLNIMIKQINYFNKNIFQNTCIKTEYQPFVDLESNEIYGFEALARFNIPFTNEIIFKKLYQNPELFFEIEHKLKLNQIQNRPKNSLLSLNFNTQLMDKINSQFWVNFFSEQENILLEIIENSNTTDLENYYKSFYLFKNKNINISLDDIGSSKNFISFELIADSNFLKFDKSWIQKIRSESEYSTLNQGIINFAKERNIKTIIEGIETRSDFDLAVESGFDYAQGYLFRNLFILR